jgi:hypothetical protein
MSENTNNEEAHTPVANENADQDASALKDQQLDEASGGAALLLSAVQAARESASAEEPSEPGLAGVTTYSDLNFNG